ncbi:TetR/AcrR family transcriptional regulator [Cytobacillus solani]|uniref:TetR family transcriptional regulator n=1 Tax=Cytobacillus solani TaxID=1637975 RepID=A0A0Q3QSL2_9BACI|nr:TetR/AcrR family transcriptional regulator [Cytobacillus solani]KQL21145.1 TetR family transcriptional regulator [Cytobacillus solani]
MGQRGRKKGSNGEQSRALLLSIAANEFAKHGYHDTKVSSIVKRAGLTQPTFYLYFQNKEAIFQELVELFRENLFSLTRKSRLEPGIELTSLSDRIAYGLAGIFIFFKENPDLTKIGFYESAIAEEIKKELAIQIEENLTSEVQNGYFSQAIDMCIFAESLVGIIERLTVTKLLPGLKGPNSLAEEIVDIFLNGIINKNS